MFYRVLFWILFPLAGICQNTIGLPDINNYHKNSYNAGLQNWDIRQDKNGIIYTANNEGLLSFDGKYWKLYPLPNKTNVKSIEIGADNKIYVGGQDELGYFAASENGQLQYHSLVELIPEKDRAFADVWDIASFKNEIFFRTSHRIFRISKEIVTVYTASSEWTLISNCNGHLYAHDRKIGLLNFENDSWLPIPNAKLTDVELTAILPNQEDGIIVTTLKNGIYTITKAGIKKIKSSRLVDFESDRIYSATAINKEWIALATTNAGVAIINHRGEPIQKISKTEGLQNNSVLSIFLDKQGNLWLGLDNGIDCIVFNNAIKRINPFFQDASAYASIIHEHRLYVGTSGGLFSVPLEQDTDLSFSRGKFTAVANTSGQVRGLAEINGKLLLAHHDGAFAVEENNAKLIAANKGFWNFVPLSVVFPTARIVAGNYRGLSFLNFRNNNFSIAEDIPDFTQSARFVVIDQNDNIWVSHPFRGLYRLAIATDGKYHTKLYTEKNGLPSQLNNHVYKVKNELVVATEKGVYKYNKSKDLFEVSDFYKSILGDQSIRYLKEDPEGNVWFIHEKKLGVVDLSTKTPSIIYIPELNNKLLSGFEMIYPVNNNNVFVGGETGLIHINFEKYKKNIPVLKAQLRAVRIIDKEDSLLFGGYFKNVNDIQEQDINKIPKINSHWQTIRFEYAAPVFGVQRNLEYSYRLKGFNDNWSEWTNKTEKEFTNLSAGKYVFEIKVRTSLGNESPATQYIFTILPPWHQSLLAVFIYFVLCCTLLVLLIIWQRRKFHLQQQNHEEEQKSLQYLNQLEKDKAETELIAIRNEKLQVEIDFKNSELTNSAMHLVQKGELLSKLKTHLSSILKVIDNDKGVEELKKMIKVISDAEKMDKDWEHFTQHFDRVHNDFIVGLKEKFPTITANELKLCAFLHMNLSTKEIAQLMNISVRGIEISRYRLRKKLNLTTEVSLFDFLIQLNASINNSKDIDPKPSIKKGVQHESLLSSKKKISDKEIFMPEI
ncbi:MAG: hypothetical protein K2Q21_06610 [Chitinophagaceae bacterium]|nr:hypothetical protein [Chitinophagaceae bacterium]